MKLVSLNCNHCGAPLQVAEDARFVTCQFCEAQLSIERTEGACFTREREEVSSQNERLAEEVGQLRLQSDLNRLDREWRLQQDELMVSGQGGQKFMPTRRFAALTPLAALVPGVVISFAMGNSASQWENLLVLLVAFLIGCAISVRMFARASTYERAERRYQRRRRELLARLRRNS